MSTRSNIAMQQEDGSYRVIYCHYDGYEEGVGHELLLRYRDPAKIKALMDLGDVSSLAPELKDVEAYGRDRGETDVEARDVPDMLSLLQNCEEYVYVYREGAWIYSHHGKEFKPLTAKVCGIEAVEEKTVKKAGKFSDVEDVNFDDIRRALTALEKIGPQDNYLDTVKAVRTEAGCELAVAVIAVKFVCGIRFGVSVFS